MEELIKEVARLGTREKLLEAQIRALRYRMGKTSEELKEIAKIVDLTLET